MGGENPPEKNNWDSKGFVHRQHPLEKKKKKQKKFSSLLVLKRSNVSTGLRVYVYISTQKSSNLPFPDGQITE